jgi:cytidine deaminase
MENPSRREALAIAAALSISVVANNAIGSDESQIPNARGNPMSEPDKKTLDDMAKRAKAVSQKAYCPYSKFRVGAVVLTDDGEMLEGCNVENASYGLTICAERNAVFQMVARAKKKIIAVVIYTPTPTPSAPCGACRQVINEFGPDALIVSVCDGKDILKKKLADLLPEAFGPANLK